MTRESHKAWGRMPAGEMHAGPFTLEVDPTDEEPERYRARYWVRTRSVDGPTKWRAVLPADGRRAYETGAEAELACEDAVAQLARDTLEALGR